MEKKAELKKKGVRSNPRPSDAESYFRARAKKAGPEFMAHFMAERAKLGLGHALSRLRKARKMSQTELAEKVGVRQATISRYESGEWERLENKTIEKILAGLGVRMTLGLEVLPNKAPKEQDASIYLSPEVEKRMQ